MEKQINLEAPKQSAEFTNALNFALGYAPTYAEYFIPTSALAQMIVDYNNQKPSPSTPTDLTKQFIEAIEANCTIEDGLQYTFIAGIKDAAVACQKIVQATPIGEGNRNNLSQLGEQC